MDKGAGPTLRKEDLCDDLQNVTKDVALSLIETI